MATNTPTACRTRYATLIPTAGSFAFYGLIAAPVVFFEGWRNAANWTLAETEGDAPDNITMHEVRHLAMLATHGSLLLCSSRPEQFNHLRLGRFIVSGSSTPPQLCRSPFRAINCCSLREICDSAHCWVISAARTDL
jgi:hypothetical protein